MSEHIIAGERRWRASTLAGQKTILARVLTNVDDATALKLGTESTRIWFAMRLSAGRASQSRSPRHSARPPRIWSGWTISRETPRRCARLCSRQRVSRPHE